MTKKWLISRISARYGDLPNINEVAEYAGINRKTASKWLEPYEPIPNGREKKYCVDDVAQAIIER